VALAKPVGWRGASSNAPWRPLNDDRVPVGMVDKSLGGVSGAFQPAKHLVIRQTEDWMLNHRVDSALPPYLVLGARLPTNDLSLLRREALARAWNPANAQKALNALLRPEHLYIGRYGHTAFVTEVDMRIWAQGNGVRAVADQRAHF
jgi:diadenosine tetraphosphate (Ap4A) HIT family hydrolase